MNNEEQLARWARFFRFESEEDLEQLAKEDPIMSQAKDALEQISQDPRIVSLAEERRLAAFNNRLMKGDARREGREEGRAEGQAAQLRVAIVGLCEFGGIVITELQRQSLQAMSLPELEATWNRIKSERKWV